VVARELYPLWLQGGCIHCGCKGAVFIVAAKELYFCGCKGAVFIVGYKGAVFIVAARELYSLLLQESYILLVARELYS
jgi:hypothetical protein